VAGSPGLWVPCAVVCGLVDLGMHAGLGPAIHGLNRGDPELRLLLSQGALLGAVVLGLYLAFLGVRWAVGRRGVRVAWLPGFLVLPLLLVGIALSPALDGVTDQVAPPSFALIGVTQLWWIVGLGGISLLAITWDQARHDGGAVGLSAVVSTWARTLPRALAPYGGAVVATFLGQQAIWPGLVYLVELAFVGQVTLLAPGARPHRRSRALVRREGAGAVVGVLAMAAVLLLPGHLALTVGAELVHAALGDPTYPDGEGLGPVIFGWFYARLFIGAARLPALGVALGGALSGFVILATTVALTGLYRDRLARRARPGRTDRPAPVSSEPVRMAAGGGASE